MPPKDTDEGSLREQILDWKTRGGHVDEIMHLFQAHEREALLRLKAAEYEVVPGLRVINSSVVDTELDRLQ